MAMLPNYYYLVPKVKWTDEGAVVTLEDHSDTDVVEVVRCRKCKHWETDWPPSGFDPDNPRYFCSVNDIFPTGDWFCKDGERREDGD